MRHDPLTLELGPGFAANPIDVDDERLIFTTCGDRSQGTHVVAAPPGIGVPRKLGALPGHGSPVGTIVGSRLRKKVYVAAEAGIWEFPFEGGEASLIAELPELPAASKLDVQAAYGANAHNANWVPHKTGKPHYRWVLELDENTQRLFTLSGQEGALDHFIEIDVGARAIVSQVRMPGFCAGIQIDLKRRRIVLPALKDGPQVLDFAGRQLAAWGHGHDAALQFWHACVRPSNGAVVLAEHEGGLWLWDWEHDKLTKLADDAAAPVLSSNDTVFFMRTSAELWMIAGDAQPSLVVRAMGNEGGEEFERKRSWVMQPKLSADGRFVLAQLTAILPTRTADAAKHDAVVVDLAARRVQQVPGFFEHTLAWF